MSAGRDSVANFAFGRVIHLAHSFTSAARAVSQARLMYKQTLRWSPSSEGERSGLKSP